MQPGCFSQAERILKQTGVLGGAHFDCFADHVADVAIKLVPAQGPSPRFSGFEYVPGSIL